MRAVTQKEIVENFEQFLHTVQILGEEIIISNDQNEKIAILIPYQKFRAPKDREIGILKGKAKFHIEKDFEMTDEELVSA